jgi:hypothetical protein
MWYQTIRNQKEWEEHGEMTTQTIFKQHTGGAMEKKDLPGLKTDGPSVVSGYFRIARDPSTIPKKCRRVAGGVVKDIKTQSPLTIAIASGCLPCLP